VIETYYVGAYWLGRKESAESCARRAEEFFRILSRYDPTFTQWFEKAYSREEALKLRFEPDAETWLKMFAKEREGAVDWFSSWVWNGEDDGNISSASFSCGSASHRVPNTCVFRPPSKGPVAERVLHAPVLVQVLRAMVLAWEPEVGIATSNEHRDQVLKKAKVGTFPGWVMYFSHRRGPVPPLPAPVHVEPVEDKGTLIVLTPERFTASNPAHVELANQVAEVLDRAGLLKPLQPWDIPLAPSR
jgi:immunity protein 52 of polymorphic toxin system